MCEKLKVVRSSCMMTEVKEEEKKNLEWWEQL